MSTTTHRLRPDLTRGSSPQHLPLHRDDYAIIEARARRRPRYRAPERDPGSRLAHGVAVGLAVALVAMAALVGAVATLYRSLELFHLAATLATLGYVASVPALWGMLKGR